ncbi:hypothetical protein [Brucella anthropi]|uniref:hypothetical protein n=1 Tax=Brucella anthropi TaxID=529 RepID=UPI002362D334|nr:hypothetical protein [Brucella anthropi]
MNTSKRGIPKSGSASWAVRNIDISLRKSCVNQIAATWTGTLSDTRVLPVDESLNLIHNLMMRSGWDIP